MRRALETALVLVVLALFCVPVVPSHARTSMNGVGLNASADAAPVCSLPQVQRRAIVGLRVIGFQPRAASSTRLEAVRAVRGDAPDPPQPRPRKCPPRRGVTSVDSPAPSALLVGPLA